MLMASRTDTLSDSCTTKGSTDSETPDETSNRSEA
jgi:hypothetical protein